MRAKICYVVDRTKNWSEDEFLNKDEKFGFDLHHDKLISLATTNPNFKFITYNVPDNIDSENFYFCALGRLTEFTLEAIASDNGPLSFWIFRENENNWVLYCTNKSLTDVHTGFKNGRS